MSGRERIYLNWFFQTLAYNQGVFSEARVDRYVQSYSRSSVLHAGFEYYRAFEKDAGDNQDHATAKLSIPVLSIGGANSRLNKYVVDQLRDGTTRLTGDLAPQSGHWIPEEQPAWLAKRCMVIHDEQPGHMFSKLFPAEHARSWRFPASRSSV